jgi:protein O-mannosyl-transferase
VTAGRNRRVREPQRPRRQDAPPREAAAGVRWRAALLALAVVVTYANSLSGPFVLDDQASIVQNPQIRDLSRMGEVLMPRPDSPVAGRPLPSLAFALNYAIGGLDVHGYHVVNIALHLACVLLAFGVFRRTFELPPVAQRLGMRGVDLACAAALLWAVHPLNSEVVDYLTQRTESMMAACFLATLYAAARAAAAQQSARWARLAVVSCALGMACKESMAIAPMMVAVYDRIFLFDSWRAALARRKWLYGGLAATWLVLAALMAPAPRQGAAGFSSGVSPWTYLLNQAVVITDYLRLSIWPHDLVAFYGWPGPLTLGDVLPYAAFITILLAITVVALARAPLLGFLGAWFFITLAPASSVVPIATEVGAERRMYLPLLALAVLAVVGADFVWRRARRYLRTGHAAAEAAALQPPGSIRSAGLLAAIPIVILIAVSGALASATIVRNGEYASALALTRTVVERRPTGVAHHMFGEQLMAAGQHEEAVRQLTEAVAKGNSRAGYQLGVALFNQGKLAEATARLEAFVSTYQLPSRLVPRWLEPPLVEVVQARLAIGQASAAGGQWRKAAEQAQWVLKVLANHVGARQLLADALFGEQRWEEAGAQYREYLQARPADGRALINLGVTQVAAGRLDEAIATFARAVEADPGNARAKQLLSMAREDRARLMTEKP